MRPVGEVVRTAQGLVIVRVPDEAHPEIGASVVDAELEGIGRVVDVFGPVDSPFVAVTPDKGHNPPSLIGSRLYERTN